MKPLDVSDETSGSEPNQNMNQHRAGSKHVVLLRQHRDSLVQKLLSFVSLSSCRRDETRRADAEHPPDHLTAGRINGLNVVSAGGGDGGGVTADREGCQAGDQ